MKRAKLPAKVARRKKSFGYHLRSIAAILERAGMRNFPAYLLASAKEISDLRWENGMLRRKMKLSTRKEQKI